MTAPDPSNILFTIAHPDLYERDTVSVEFKRCGNGAEADTFESICAFLNRFGGDERIAGSLYHV